MIRLLMVSLMFVELCNDILDKGFESCKNKAAMRMQKMQKMVKQGVVK